MITAVFARMRCYDGEVREWVAHSDGRYGIWSATRQIWCDVFGGPQQMRMELLSHPYVTAEGTDWLSASHV